jgi:hypothetical protein
MTELPVTAVGPVLSALRTLPVWLLGGAALAGYSILFVPAFDRIDASTFRTQWGAWVWVEAIFFTALTVARLVDIAIAGFLERRKEIGARRSFRLALGQEKSWWHLAKQQDDSYCSQISLHIDATNLTDRPIRFISARLVRPIASGGILNSMVLLPQDGSPYHSDKHAVPPHDTETASVHIMVRGALAEQGKSLRLSIGLTDQLGEEYQLKDLVVQTTNPPLPRLPLIARLGLVLRTLTGTRRAAELPPADGGPVPTIWQHGGKFEQVDLVLIEERRNYAARGRTSGGLGSLNVTLQSEPNHGWTTVGKVPSLLWDEAQATSMESPNAARLIGLHGKLDGAARTEFEEYLVSHLHKRSTYADVGYFIFFVLHRMGRSTDALRAARSNLAGDKVYGYSNVLGTLSAIVSHEHFRFDPNLFPQILEALAGDEESNFRLPEKINLARLQRLDLELRPTVTWPTAQPHTTDR